MVFGFPQGSLMCGGCIQFWVSGNEKKPLFFLNILKNRGGGVGVDVRVLALGSGGAKSLYGRFPHTGTYFFPLRALPKTNEQTGLSTTLLRAFRLQNHSLIA